MERLPLQAQEMLPHPRAGARSLGHAHAIKGTVYAVVIVKLRSAAVGICAIVSNQWVRGLVDC